MMTDAFECRRLLPSSSCFHGPVSIKELCGQAYTNYCNLLIGGFMVRVFFNGVERHDCVAADPEEGWVVAFIPNVNPPFTLVTLKGPVEIMIKRKR